MGVWDQTSGAQCFAVDSLWPATTMILISSDKGCCGWPGPQRPLVAIMGLWDPTS